MNEPENYLLGDTDYRDHADFRYAIRRFLRHSEKQARACGITPQQHMLLLIVRGHPSYPAVSIGEIAERLQLRHHSGSLLVERDPAQQILAGPAAVPFDSAGNVLAVSHQLSAVS